MDYCRKLVITLVSANDLPDIRRVFRMKIYAEVSIKGNSETSTKYTSIDYEREANPRWNFPVEFTIRESDVRKPGVDIKIKLFCARTFGDKLIGEVNVPVKGLFDTGLKSKKNLSYKVGGTSSGKLNILYSFGKKIAVKKANGRRGNPVGSQGSSSVLVGDALNWLSGELNGDDNEEDKEAEEAASQASETASQAASEASETASEAASEASEEEEEEKEEEDEEDEEEEEEEEEEETEEEEEEWFEI